jgi:hypothetical protein
MELTRTPAPHQQRRRYFEPSTVHARIPEILSTLRPELHDSGGYTPAIFMFQRRIIDVIVKPRRPIFGVP